MLGMMTAILVEGGLHPSLRPGDLEIMQRAESAAATLEEAREARSKLQFLNDLVTSMTFLAPAGPVVKVPPRRARPVHGAVLVAVIPIPADIFHPPSA